MNASVYVGIIIFVLGIFTWLFGASKLKALQNSFVPASPAKIRLFQAVSWIGALCSIGGIVLAILSLK